ncbi:MAG: hypothetical protein E7320_03790 [Clostridiales bacterium]|nr:hypothetical protein [Clostridiales bacterium]
MLKRIFSMMLSLLLCASAMPIARGEEAALPQPKELPPIAGLPELMRLSDGTPVTTPEQWAQRRKELLSLYSFYMYGYMPDKAGETLSYAIEDYEATGGKLLTITIANSEGSASFSVLVTLPETPAPEKGYPYYIEYTPYHYRSWFTGQWVNEASQNCVYAARRGYAGINYDCSQVAPDNKSFTGAFYTLYPYKLLDQNSRNGTLLAWAWGVSKIIDAMEQGAGAELNIDPALSLVGGVSRYGKSAAVAGAYEQRIKVVIPSCSGAGGIATYRTNNSGKSYDLTSLGGPAAWVNESANEPLSNLQGGEGYWFCGRFAVIPSVEQIPVDQHMLAALVASPERHMIIVTGITSEGWNNTEGQCLAYAASQPAWDLLGCPDQNNMIIHLDGHAILPSDMQMILDYCDVHLFGKAPDAVETDLSQMKGNLFLEHNREGLYPEFAPYLEN